ncbi:MAG: hypothetical protein ACUVSK_11705, partial [Desulfotomaculales bacterium]
APPPPPGPPPPPPPPPTRPRPPPPGAEEGKRKTKLRVITQDGKTVELEIPGEIKIIESSREEKKEGESSGGT